MITGSASGISTRHSRCRRVKPIVVADSRTEAGTPSMPATKLFRNEDLERVAHPA